METIWLCKCNINWADEADFEYFEIFTDKQKKDFINKLKKYKDVSAEISFGTNEYSDYTGEDILNCLSWKIIKDESILKFLKSFVVNGCHDISSVLDSFEDQYEDEDEDEKEVYNDSEN